MNRFKCADNDACKLQCSRMELEMMTGGGGGFCLRVRPVFIGAQVCFWCASQLRQERVWKVFYDIQVCGGLQALALNLFWLGSSEICCVCLFGFVCSGWRGAVGQNSAPRPHEKRGLGVQEWTPMWFVYSLKANRITVGFYDSGLVLVVGFLKDTFMQITFQTLHRVSILLCVLWHLIKSY